MRSLLYKDPSLPMVLAKTRREGEHFDRGLNPAQLIVPKREEPFLPDQRQEGSTPASVWGTVSCRFLDVYSRPHLLRASWHPCSGSPRPPYPQTQQGPTARSYSRRKETLPCNVLCQGRRRGRPALCFMLDKKARARGTDEKGTIGKGGGGGLLPLSK